MKNKNTMQYSLKKKYKSNNQGFTLVELIVALGLFAVVSTISIGSLITLMDNNRQLRGDQAMITNAGFAFDMMTRDIRQGVDYWCETFFLPQAANPPGTNNRFRQQNDLGADRRDCVDGFNDGSPVAAHGISFRPPETLIDETDDTRIAYYYDRDLGTIMRRIGTNNPESIISNTLTIIDADFVVTDTADEFLGDGSDRQPTVTIFLVVQAEDGNEYRLQSTVTQRLLDI